MTRLLDQIEKPADLRGLEADRLPQLAREIRGEIIETVSKNGGHLAPSLGAVELTLALHYVFNTPDDRLIWDVGHQAYAHKLITGRRDRFHTLRTHGGLSGFLKKDESPYDVFGAGHASTSISAALGVSEALSLKNAEDKVIAVIGDGSMTGGMAFEGLNQAGALDRDLIVVLNDNEMSISPNVGALSSFLSRKMTKRSYAAFKQEVKEFLKTVPGVGESVIRLVQRSEGSFKGFISPSFLFEAFKFEYIGPIRGHRFDRLIEALTNAKYLEGPVLVHVMTTKGKGYEPAEQNPTYFHGVGAFHVDTGNCQPSGAAAPTYTDVFGRFMVRAAEADDRVVVITAAMPEGTGLTEFRERFPDRFFDVGIAEQHAVTFAAGLAVEGYRPVVAIYSTFLQRAYDQIYHDVCLQNLPVVFALDRGGLVGADGCTHHGVLDLSYLRSMCHMTVAAPKDEVELESMLAFGLKHDGPFAVRYPRGRGVGACADDRGAPIELGRSEVVRDGRDLLVLAAGNVVHPALEAAETLAAQGVDAQVVNARFVKPLDAERITAWARERLRVLTVEENTALGGFGSAVAETLVQAGVDGLKMKILGTPDRPVSHGSQALLRAEIGLDPQGIARAARELMGR
jgi:1-deoxy-D-xylulose-5-phosphate synthase